MKSKVLNGKVGPHTFFTIAYHTGEKYYFVSPKLPGMQTVRVASEEEGRQMAERLYMNFIAILWNFN